MYKLPDNLSCQTTEDFRKLENFRKLSEIIEIDDECTTGFLKQILPIY